MSATTIPNVGTLTSSALTDTQVNVIMQALLLQMLGVAVDLTNPLDPGYALVRIGWPVSGQPAFLITEDVAFVLCTPEADEADEQYESQWSPQNDDGTYTRTTVYTRVWRVALVFYGPNSLDRSRQIKACLFLPFANDGLALSNLFLLGRKGSPRRAPELFQGQWWPRVDFAFKMNEQVTETLNLPSMASVELILEDATGILYDQVISPQGYGEGEGFGDGSYGV